ncbi:hypothetical protein PIB30_002296 [Stylosanthes scabra]|uniref:Protein kinase domain-containing protein n=1 Tax=Stylosanthes scabra TaxID=79078 RepID=A0ABU6U4V8_9FABA|nr:hypothetical protein [Stylosanthes scabra]
MACSGFTKGKHDWLVVFPFVMLILIPQKSFSEKTACNVTSSCGKISNIRYPFRLKSDPPNCGDSRYELECVNDVALLRLTEEAEYKVESINYNNYTIRLVDPNIEQDNCSSLPRHFLYKFNFSDASSGSNQHWDVDKYHATQLQKPDMEIFSAPLFEHIIYMSCNIRVTEYEGEYEYFSSRHRVSNKNNNNSCLDLHTYAVVGDLNATGPRWWKPGCHVKMIAATSAGFLLRHPENQPIWQAPNFSYADIHISLAYGFELSWLHLHCHHSCTTRTCYFNRTTQNASCFSPCTYLRYTDSLARIHCGKHSLTILKKVWSSNDAYLILRVVAGQITVDMIGIRVLMGTTLLVVLIIRKWRRRHMSSYANIEIFLQDNKLAPIRYSYREIKMMTKNFKEKLGKGGFGSVYKGKLRSGPLVAIKMLDTSKSKGQDFISEVATIGRIHHMNVVRLIGFCIEGSKRALVYDFMPNGSLDTYILSKEENISLSYEKIYQISLGVARGISYLHEGCDMQILHFDIKPHNILLDENFIPKVSDFGLAKLYPIDDSIVTLTDQRGTVGYIAPELFYRNIGGVSYKADVYSFGKLLMEMANRRKNLNPHAENSSRVFFPTWIYHQFSNGRDIELDNCTEEEKNKVKKMIIVALWCIQLKPRDRPSMKQVVEMLEGEAEDLTMPPEPSLFPDEEELDSKLHQTSRSDYDSESASSSYLGDTTNSNISENCLSTD